MEDMPAWSSPSVAQRRDLACPVGVRRCETDDADCTEASVRGRKHQKADTGFVSRCSNMAATRNRQSRSGLSGANSCVTAWSFSINSRANDPLIEVLAIAPRLEQRRERGEVSHAVEH
jgi:hypothetical protein